MFGNRAFFNLLICLCLIITGCAAGQFNEHLAVILYILGCLQGIIFLLRMYKNKIKYL